MDNSDLIINSVDPQTIFSLISNHSGLGIMGIVGVIICVFINWKTSKNKSITKRFEKIEKKKEEVKSEVIKNEARVNAVFQEIKKDEKKEEKKLEEIKEKTDQLDNKIDESLNQLDVKTTVKRINDKWD